MNKEVIIPTPPQEEPVEPQSRVVQLALYTLSTIGIALLVVFLFAVSCLVIFGGVDLIRMGQRECNEHEETFTRPRSSACFILDALPGGGKEEPQPGEVKVKRLLGYGDQLFVDRRNHTFRCLIGVETEGE